MSLVTLSWDFGSTGDEQLEMCMADAMTEALKLWCKKQRDYGPRNIAMMGEAGVVTRLNDKVQRLITLTNLDSMGSPIKAENESMRDSWLDAMNYAAMGLLLRDGKWPLGGLSDEPGKCPHCGKAL